MSDITIRPYENCDLAALVGLARALQANEIDLFDRMKSVEAIGPWYVEALLAAVAKADGAILVAHEAGGAILGYAALRARISTEDVYDEEVYLFANIDDLCVAPEARGRGVGTRLIEACEDLARARGVRHLRISVLARNDRAHRLYLAAGFDDHLLTMEKALR